MYVLYHRMPLTLITNVELYQEIQTNTINLVVITAIFSEENKHLKLIYNIIKLIIKILVEYYRSNSFTLTYEDKLMQVKILRIFIIYNK